MYGEPATSMIFALFILVRMYLELKYVIQAAIYDPFPSGLFRNVIRVEFSVAHKFTPIIQ